MGIILPQQHILEPTVLLPKLHKFNYDKWLTPGYTFRHDLVEDVIELAAECPYTMDTITTRAGQPFNFLEWQIYELLVPVFGIVHEDTGKRRFRRVVFFVPRKNGKSGLTSVLMIYLLGFDGEQRPMLYSIAKNKDQAGIVFEEAVLMIEGSPYLRDRFTCYNSKHDKRIISHLNNGVWKVLSHDSKDKDGLNMHGMSADEIQQYNDSDAHVVRILHTSTSTRTQSLEFEFGTMGVESGDVPFWKRRYDEAKAVLEKPELDPTLFPLIFECPPGGDIWEEKNWFIANPSLGKVKTVEYMRSEASKAKLNPLDEGEFKRLELNISTSSQESWIPLDTWEACKDVAFNRESVPADRPCFLALDYAEVRDFVALQEVFPPYHLDKDWRVLSNFWLPELRLATREKTEKRPYMAWVNQGFLRHTPGSVIDREIIFEYIIKTWYHRNIKGIAFDPYHLKVFEDEIKKLAKRLYEQGDISEECYYFWAQDRKPEDHLFVEWRQVIPSMSGPTKEFEKLVFLGADGKYGLKHDGNPILRFMVDCTIMERDSNGNKKPDKKRSTNRIDGVVASIMGVGLGLMRSQKKSLEEIMSDPTWGF
ncbi:MAG: hypothetical protein K2X93_17305 [Candidatus Obscuribacterales bacterium]|nr:hypothetical protein [Candidatus Obscuribacterales bacterium]